MNEEINRMLEIAKLNDKIATLEHQDMVNMNQIAILRNDLLKVHKKKPIHKVDMEAQWKLAHKKLRARDEVDRLERIVRNDPTYRSGKRV